MNDLSKSNHGDCTASLIPASIEQICSSPGRLSHWFDHNLHGLSPIFPRLLLAYEFGEAGLEKLHGDNWFSDLSFLLRSAYYPPTLAGPWRLTWKSSPRLR